MPNQTIPITLQAGVFPPGYNYSSPQEFATALASIMSGSLRADVTFILNVLFDPTTFQTQLIFNVTQQVLKSWDTSTGSYRPLTQYQIGDVKNSFVGQDQISTGWVLLNGRQIDAVPGATTAQIATMETLFGVDGMLPNVVPVNGGDLPAASSFSGIVKPDVEPAAGVIAALPISDPPTQAEVEALRDATDTLRESTAAVETQASEIQDKSADLLAALRNNTTPPMYSLVFIGYA